MKHDQTLGKKEHGKKRAMISKQTTTVKVDAEAQKKINSTGEFSSGAFPQQISILEQLTGIGGEIDVLQRNQQ